MTMRSDGPLALLVPVVGVVALAALPARSATRTPNPTHQRAAQEPGRQTWAMPAGVALLVLVVVSGDPRLVVVAAAAGLAGDRMLQHVRRRRARLDVEASIVPVLDELARGLRAGFAPAVAFDAALRHASATKQTMGARDNNGLVALPELDAQLARWAGQATSTSVDDVVAQLRLGTRLGTLHPDFVAAVSQSLVEQRQLDDEIVAQSSQARASAVVMTVAPLLFFVALVLTDPRASRLMLHSVLGAVLLIAGLTLDVVGFLWMRRLASSVLTMGR